MDRGMAGVSRQLLGSSKIFSGADNLESLTIKQTSRKLYTHQPLCFLSLYRDNENEKRLSRYRPRLRFQPSLYSRVD